MGGGRWDDDAYASASYTRSSRGIDDFAYSKVATAIHPSLDPTRINNKPFGKLESRDSAEHPESNAILVEFDVTGSNRERAKPAQKALPKLMNLLEKYIAHPQIAVAANDDYMVEPNWSLQISDFESDNRIDEHIRNIKLVGNGGANDGESYDLVLYAAARKTVLDCFEKRGRKGYLFMYADEPFFDRVSSHQVAHVFGDVLARNIPIRQIIEEARKLYHIFILWPVGGYTHAYNQYVDLFGQDSVLTLQDPNKICETIGATIGVNEGKVDAAKAADDLVAVGVSRTDAARITAALVPLANSRAVGKTSGGLPTVGVVKRGGAARL